MTRRTAVFLVIAAACLFGGAAAVVAGAIGKTSQKTNARVGVVGTVVGATRIEAHADSAQSAPVRAPVSFGDAQTGSTTVVAPHPGPQRPQTLIVRAQNPTEIALNGAVTSIPIGGGTPRGSTTTMCSTATARTSGAHGQTATAARSVCSRTPSRPAWSGAPRIAPAVGGDVVHLLGSYTLAASLG